MPLNRKEGLSCGPFRESGGQIRKGVGPGYQNLLGSDTSRFLLEVIKPTVVFSGDDHDYCHVTHPNGVKEVTVKSFSSSAGIRRPGLQLLSLVPPTEFNSGQADRPCILPDQVSVYTRVYLPFALFTIAFLLITNIRTAWARSSASAEARRMSPPEEKRRQASLPLTLPSRRSATHLQALAKSSPRERHAGIVTPAPSAPTSPLLSPRMQFYTDDYDPEMAEVPGSPVLSRRSSYAADLGSMSRSANAGLLSTPTLQPNPRRPSAVPRMLSATDWASAARAKDVSVLSLVADKGKTAVYSSRVRGFVRWLWRARNSFLVKTWRETIAVAIPAAIVWMLMNALFFWESA